MKKWGGAGSEDGGDGDEGSGAKVGNCNPSTR